MEHLDRKAIEADGDVDLAKLSDSCVEPALLRTMIASAPHNNTFFKGIYLARMGRLHPDHRKYLETPH
jgi:hypothetical protein